LGDKVDMDYIFFDTETTSIKPGQIGQLAYIIQTANNEITGKNHYFEVAHVESDAAAVTGMDTDFYRQASGGIKFADKAIEISEDFSNKLAVAHNIKFDTNFINIEMFRADIYFNMQKTFDTMVFFRDICKIPSTNRKYGAFKNPKLVEVVRSLNIDEEKVARYSEKIFNIPSGSFHNAMYDTTALLVAFNVYREIHNGICGYWRDTFVRKGAY